MTAKRRVVFLSRDRGSVQATVPVIHALSGAPWCETVTVSLDVSRPVLDERGISSEPLDERFFKRSAAACISELFARVRPNLLVSGSSPAKGAAPETPEQHAILVARGHGVPSLGILDYWGMYTQRFSRSGQLIDLSLVPDRLCVLDRRCFDDLRILGVPADRMVITHNPWMDEIVRQSSNVTTTAREPGDGLNVLFVSQPFTETRAVRGWTFTQSTLLERLVDALPQATVENPHRVTIWTHPAESPAQWKDAHLLGRPDVLLAVGEARGYQAFTRIDMLVSGHSTVAYEALYRGIPCISLRDSGDTLLTEELGLTQHFEKAEAFKEFLNTNAIQDLRRDLHVRRAALASAGVFFSDGNATSRVTAEILTTLARTVGTQ